jgi:hypothetical protein
MGAFSIQSRMRGENSAGIPAAFNLRMVFRELIRAAGIGHVFGESIGSTRMAGRSSGS